MNETTGVLIGYCVLILLASLAGGWIPHFVRLTHRRMEFALSFVAGVMFGVAMLHLLPHAIMESIAAAGDMETAGGGDHDHDHGWHEVLDPVLMWVVGGFVFMFLIERFFCFHHHDAPHEDASDPHPAGHGACGSGHGHALTWGGAAIGLTLHTLVAGVALAAAVQSGHDHGAAALPAGFGTFLVIFLHKPFDSLTIATLMAAARRPNVTRHLVNGLFSLAIPVGVILFYLGFDPEGAAGAAVLPAALAFSAGAFLCIALSDVLPELQFHQHDRTKLSLALILGLAAAWLIRLMEAHGG